MSGGILSSESFSFLVKDYILQLSSVHIFLMLLAGGKLYVIAYAFCLLLSF